MDDAPKLPQPSDAEPEREQKTRGIVPESAPELPAEQGGQKKGFQNLFLVTEEERAESREAARVNRLYPAQMKARIMDDIKPRLLAGERIKDLAAEHGLPWRTLEYWLAQLGDEYRGLRRAWIDSKLVDAEVGVAEAPDKLELLRARELVRIAQWYAERRDPERYAPKSELTVKEDDPKTPDEVRTRITELEARLNIRTIEPETAESAP